MSRLQVVNRVTGSENEQSGDKRRGFHRFNELIHVEKIKPEKLCEDVKQFYMTLHEWFSDPVLFHFVGFLINENTKLLELVRLSKSSCKTQNQTHLRNRSLGLNQRNTRRNKKAALKSKFQVGI